MAKLGRNLPFPCFLFFLILSKTRVFFFFFFIERGIKPEHQTKLQLRICSHKKQKGLLFSPTHYMKSLFCQFTKSLHPLPFVFRDTTPPHCSSFHPITTQNSLFPLRAKERVCPMTRERVWEQENVGFVVRRGLGVRKGLRVWTVCGLSWTFFFIECHKITFSLLEWV